MEKYFHLSLEINGVPLEGFAGIFASKSYVLLKRARAILPGRRLISHPASAGYDLHCHLLVPPV